MSKVETIGGVAVGNKPKYHPEMWYPFTLYRGEEAEKGWQHVKPLKARHVTPTKIVSTDCESSWTMYDKQIINPEEWYARCSCCATRHHTRYSACSGSGRSNASR